jgi:arylsulfatase A-like enzyme
MRSVPSFHPVANLARLLLAGLGAFSLSLLHASVPPRPNILFIAVDDLRPELGTYGQKHIISPNIDRLAAQGVQFNRAYAQAPICMSSRASLLTSIHPSRTRISSTTAVIDKDLAGAVTLPEVFRHHGYYAVANGKIMHEATDTADRSWDEPVWMPPTRPFSER